MRLRSVALAALASIWSAEALCGGPFVVDQVGKTGVAQRWQGDTVSWYADSGALTSSIDNAAAIAMVVEQFDKWANITLENAKRESVRTCTLKHSYKGKSSEDITKNNINKYLDSSEGRTFVVFDHDGSITSYLGFDKESVVGLSTPLESASDGLRITKGIVILNGYLLQNGTLTEAQFKAALLHELGHLINMDHSQIFYYEFARYCSLDKPCSEAQYIPTMYPNLVSETQATLTWDDKITASWIYPNAQDPSQKFHPDFAAITGSIYDADGMPLKGVNVIARRCDRYDEITQSCALSSMALVDARSMVSGVLYPGFTGPEEGTPDGRYYLYGLKPGERYVVLAEPIAAEFTGASGFEPISNPPSGFSQQPIPDADGSETVAAPGAGEIHEMASLAIDVPNPCPKTICYKKPSDGGGGKACSLAAGASAGDAWSAGAYLAAALLAIAQRRSVSRR